MKLIKLSAIDSTNSYLKELVKTAPFQDEVVVVATRQLNGRGQHGAGWQSQPSKSLTFSMFKQFESVLIAQQTLLSFCVSLALYEVLVEYKIPDLSIKWPNDIMSRQHKLAGILVENSLKGPHLASSVIGIGLNVNETEFNALPQATSMNLATGKTFQIDKLLNDIATAVFYKLSTIALQDISEVKKAYESVLFRKDRISVFETPNGIQKNGRIRGVTLDGLLTVEHDDDQWSHYGLKEVKLLY